MAQTRAQAWRQFNGRKLPDRKVYQYAEEARKANEPIRVIYRGGVFFVYPSGVYQYIGEGRSNG